ncbi:MAG: hypothetical protein ABIY55_13370 [Kofleriaceae bacterium]
MGDDKNIDKLRYHKIIIMSVDAQEHVFVRGRGGVALVRIGDFIDRALTGVADDADGVARRLGSDGDLGEVLCFGVDDHLVRFRSIKGVIRHPLDEKLYQVQTAAGRSLRVTASHSVFVHEDGEVRRKRGDELAPGDRVVAPRQLRLPAEAPPQVDLLRTLHADLAAAQTIWVRGPAVTAWFAARVTPANTAKATWTAARMVLPADLRVELAALRRAAKISNGQLCQVLGIRQPGTFQAWELGTSQPTQSQLEVYLLAIGADGEAVWPRVLSGPSRLAQICDAEDAEDLEYVLAQIAGGSRDYVRLAALEREDLDWFADRDDLMLAPEPRGKPGIARRIELTAPVLALIGGYVASGAPGQPAISLSVAEGGGLDGVAAQLAAVFGLPAEAVEISPTTNGVLLAHRVAAQAWRALCGDEAGLRVPDLVWSVSEELRSAFLRGFIQTGETGRAGGVVRASAGKRAALALVATSRDLASGLTYLLASYGVVGTSRQHDGRWTLTVDNPAELARLGAVWQGLAGGAVLAASGHEGPAFAARPFEPLDGDLMTLAITEITEVAASNGNVYDFSVADDENFIAGFGGLAACNTDADVDGSHIRTLLLTFFFRHFNELFEKGHVYIAQPPLYKVKKGKTELYLKNEGALEDYLLDSVCRETVLQRGTETPLTNTELAALVKRISQAQRLRAQLDKRSDGRITAQFAEAGLSEDDLKDRDKLERLEAKVMAEVSKRHGELGQASASYTQDLEHGTWALRFPPGVHGIRRATVLNSDVVRSAEFIELRRISAELKATLMAPVSLKHQSDDAQPIDNWDEIATMVEELGRKGLQIQRYKGLGEMNAEQLWETTMDPTKRNLLRVKIEEMEAADGIFSKLMGDLVEPRRAFIEENALNVRNLDV